MSTLSKILIVIAIIGAVNWGLIGLFGFNVVTAVFGGSTEAEVRIIRIVYAVVGVCGLFALITLPALHGRRWLEHHRSA